jgi:ferredoxin-NADP reductase
MFLSAIVNDKPCARAYTPTSSDDDIGFFDLVVKVWVAVVRLRTSLAEVYPQGLMSQHLDHLKIGDSILVQGPKGRLTYLGNGLVQIKVGDAARQIQVTHLGMMAGGTGITPMLQV